MTDQGWHRSVVSSEQQAVSATKVMSQVSSLTDTFYIQDFQTRVGHSHWSTSVQILSSDWWTSYYAGDKVYVMTTTTHHIVGESVGNICAFRCVVIAWWVSHVQKESVIDTWVSNIWVYDPDWTRLVTVITDTFYHSSSTPTWLTPPAVRHTFYDLIDNSSSYSLFV